jgi:hypothetical protein
LGVWPQFAEAVFILGARLDGIGAGDLTKAAYGAADFFGGRLGGRDRRRDLCRRWCQECLILMGFLFSGCSLSLGNRKGFLYIFSARCRVDKIKKPLFLFRRSTLPGITRVVAKSKSDNPPSATKGSG